LAIFAAIRRASMRHRSDKMIADENQKWAKVIKFVGIGKRPRREDANLSAPEQHNAFRINTDEYLLPNRQCVECRAARDKLLTAPKEMHLGEVALKDRLVDARDPDVTRADRPLCRNLQVNRTY